MEARQRFREVGNDEQLGGTGARQMFIEAGNDEQLGGKKQGRSLERREMMNN
jgi:hypothetical protein